MKDKRYFNVRKFIEILLNFREDPILILELFFPIMSNSNATYVTSFSSDNYCCIFKLYIDYCCIIPWMPMTENSPSYSLSLWWQYIWFRAKADHLISLKQYNIFCTASVPHRLIVSVENVPPWTRSDQAFDKYNHVR